MRGNGWTTYAIEKKRLTSFPFPPSSSFLPPANSKCLDRSAAQGRIVEVRWKDFLSLFPLSSHGAIEFGRRVHVEHVE